MSKKLTGNSMAFPKDETTPWGTDGITVSWQAEAASAPAAKPKFGESALKLKKLMALVPITDELLSDTNALTSYMPKKVASRMQWKINESILFGGGQGIPLGALASGAVLTQAKDSGQATNTLSALNLANMIARLPPGSFKNAVWIVNNDVLPALFTLSLGNYQDCVANILNWYRREASKADLVCANRRHPLLRDGYHTCWQQTSCDAFIEAAVTLWNKW